MTRHPFTTTSTTATATATATANATANANANATKKHTRRSGATDREYNAPPMRATLIVVVLILSGLGAYGFYVSRKPPEVAPERIIDPRKGTIVQGVIAVGRVEPRTRIDVKCKANGIIRKLLVDVADPVKEGQVIAELDQEILAARVAEAEGKLQSARGAIELAKSERKRLEVEKSDPELSYARRNWERLQKLNADGLASEDEKDQAHDRFDKSQYKLRLLDAQIEAANALTQSAEGRLREVQAQAELAKQELLEATVLSPITGVVLHRYLEEGDSVSSIRVAGGNATVIMSIGDLSELYVDGQVDEVDVGKIISQQRIRPDLEARVTVESFKGQKQGTFLGRVARIAPLGLEDSNGIVTFEVRIILDNPEKLLLANMTANSQIVLNEKKDVLLLTQGALISKGAERFVDVFDPHSGRTSRKKVEVGISDGSQVEITGGLDATEKVLLP